MPLQITGHCTKRMSDRGVTFRAIERIVRAGNVDALYYDYGDRWKKRFVGTVEGRTLMVVAAWDGRTDTTLLITVYEPGKDQPVS